jgi:hypothetical protein
MEIDDGLAPYLVPGEPGSTGLQSKVFFIWGSTCFCGIIFSFLCIPEVRSCQFLFLAYLVTDIISISDTGIVSRTNRCYVS